MFARFYQNKCSKFLIIFLSKVVVKETWVMQKYKKMDTKEVQSKKKEKKRKRKRDENKHNLYSRKNISQERNVFQIA